MKSVTISSKGQILIPKRLREKYHIEAGSRIILEENDNVLIIRPLSKNYIKSLRGILTSGNLPKEMDANRREELEIEERKLRALDELI